MSLWMACRPPLMPPRSRRQMPIYVLRNGRQTVVRRADVGSGELGIRRRRRPDQGADARQGAGAAGGHGDRVEQGQRLAVIEAMKMEHALTAPRAGRRRRDRGRGGKPGRGGRQSDDRRAIETSDRGRGSGTSDMPLHLIKLCVGTDSIEDLEDWIKLKLKEQSKRGARSPSASTPPAWCPSAPRNCSTAARSIG